MAHENMAELMSIWPAITKFTEVEADGYPEFTVIIPFALPLNSLPCDMLNQGILFQDFTGRNDRILDLFAF